MFLVNVRGSCRANKIILGLKGEKPIFTYNNLIINRLNVLLRIFRNPLRKSNFLYSTLPYCILLKIFF